MKRRVGPHCHLTVSFVCIVSAIFWAGLRNGLRHPGTADDNLHRHHEPLFAAERFHPSSTAVAIAAGGDRHQPTIGDKLVKVEHKITPAAAATKPVSGDANAGGLF
jgi:hypothetical protein